MKKHEELYYTIRSLSGPEVRYFKIFAKRHVIGETNNYVRLFDVVRDQTEYSDEEIRSVFKKEAFVRNLASAKYYLLQLIQKALYYYYDKEDPLSVALRHIKLAEIYYTKSLHELAESHLKKARKVASKEELFELSLLISELRLKNSIASAEDNQLSELINDEMEYEKEMFRRYLNLRQFQHAFVRFKTLEKKIFIPTTQSEKRKYDLILQQPLFNSAENALSNRSKTIFYALKKSYEDKRYDKLNEQEVNEEMLDFFIQYPQLLGKNASAFLQGIEIYLIDRLEKGDLIRFSNSLAKLKKLRTPSQILNAQIIYRAALLELNPSYLKENAVDSVQIINDCETELKSYNISISLPLILSLYHQQSAWLFSKGSFKQALKWNLKIISEVRIKPTSEIYRKASMANLILHYKLFNYDLLENRIISEKRKYKSSGSSPTFEGLLVNVLQKLIHTSKNSGFHKVKQLFEAKLELNKTKKETRIFLEDAFFKWALAEDKKSHFFIQQ